MTPTPEIREVLFQELNIATSPTTKKEERVRAMLNLHRHLHLLQQEEINGNKS